MADQSASFPTGTEFTVNNYKQLDASGNPLPTPDPTYGAPAWVPADPSTLVAGPSNSIQASFTNSGVAETTTLTGTMTSSDSTKPPLTNVITLTFTAPAPASFESTIAVVPA